MTRFDDWDARLIAYLAERLRMPFAWGFNDCCTLARGAVEAMTGEDAMAGLEPYTKERGAAKTLRAAGVRSFVELVDARFERVPGAFAQRGDLALAVLGGRETLCVVEGETICGPGERGLVRLPREVMTVAWRVG
jgi:hypothetical protein